MAITDKLKNATQKVVGKAEEVVGKKTDDPELVAQSQKDQAMGEARQQHEKAKDATN